LADVTVSMALFLGICGLAALALFHMLYERLNGGGEETDPLAGLVRWLERLYDRWHPAPADA
ncbi:MAG: hypothetical protein IJ092_02180, partial [Atopobiaceae bacterium]|nr:hypothetical protein [Atopobiaceae bacterium]